jgi:predicted RNA-binding Zn ribbon-like protein
VNTRPSVPARSDGNHGGLTHPSHEQLEPGARIPAPGDLRTVQQFINSIDIEEGTEEFATPAALGSWLHAHGLTRRRARLDEADLARAVAFRELLRAMALANNGRPLEPGVIREFNRQLGALPLVARVDSTGAVWFESAGTGLDQALGRIVAIVGAEILRGRWQRLKACARDVCRWAFYDHSRNRSGTWCSMSVCGARTKVKAYYRRHHPGVGRTSRGSAQGPGAHT